MAGMSDYSHAERELAAALFSGDYDGLTVAELRERFPEAGAAREERLRRDAQKPKVEAVLYSATESALHHDRVTVEIRLSGPGTITSAERSPTASGSSPASRWRRSTR
jgi:hypothetical protein